MMSTCPGASNNWSELRFQIDTPPPLELRTGGEMTSQEPRTSQTPSERRPLTFPVKFVLPKSQLVMLKKRTSRPTMPLARPGTKTWPLLEITATDQSAGSASHAKAREEKTHPVTTLTTTMTTVTETNISTQVAPLQQQPLKEPRQLALLLPTSQ